MSSMWRTSWRLIFFEAKSVDCSKEDLEITARGAGAWIWLAILAGLTGDYIGAINMFGAGMDFSTPNWQGAMSVLLLTSFYGITLALLMFVIKSKAKEQLQTFKKDNQES